MAIDCEMRKIFAAQDPVDEVKAEKHDIAVCVAKGARVDVRHVD